MADGEHDNSSHDSQTALLAAFATLVVATGSAFVWRSSLKRPASALLNSTASTVYIPSSSSSTPPPDTNYETTYMDPIHAKLSSEEAGTSDLVKQSRSKERRRRGKDPIKELLKAERKGKSSAKLIVASQPVTVDIGQPKQAVSASDRSRSASAASSSRARLPERQDDAPLDPQQSEKLADNSDEDTHLQDSVSASTCTPGTHASTSTADTSPQSSVIIHSETTVPPSSDPGPWDWDGNAAVYNSIPVEASSTAPSQPPMKPPRFRSHSRQAESTSTSSSSLPSPETFSFPTLNGGTRTPKRTPTPSGSVTGTPPPSLSLQTQLASLRGALEATRLREEKTRKEMERIQKEADMYKWESRRREAELQAQIHALLHQLQAYSMYPPPTFSPISGPTPPVPGMYPTSTPGSPSYHQWPPPPSSVASPTPTAPTSSSSPAAPFFVPTSAQTPHQLYSTGLPQSLFPTSGSPSPSPSSRGRRRARPIEDDGWVLTSTSNLKGEPTRADSPLPVAQPDEEGEIDPLGDEEQVNEVLLDAIMKRPDSMRSNSLKLKPSMTKRPPLEELTFPSIADSMVVYSTETKPDERNAK